MSSKPITITLLAVLLGTLHSNSLRASSPSSIVVRVEEQWELHVGVPDPNSVAPQVSMVLSPKSALNSWHTTVELNHRTEPYYAEGGVHIQLWNGDQLVADAGWGEFQCIRESEEIIRWSQVLEVRDGQLRASVENGTGSSWANFGQGIEVAANAPVYDLNDYRVDTSIEESGVSLAGNRVKQLVLRKVRYTMADGSVSEETVNRSVQ